MIVVVNLLVDILYAVIDPAHPTGEVTAMSIASRNHLPSRRRARRRASAASGSATVPLIPMLILAVDRLGGDLRQPAGAAQSRDRQL